MDRSRQWRSINSSFLQIVDEERLSESEEDIDGSFTSTDNALNLSFLSQTKFRNQNPKNSVSLRSFGLIKKSRVKLKQVSVKNFHDVTLARMNKSEARQRKSQFEILQEKDTAEKQACTFKPKLDSASQKMTKNSAPLHLRLDKLTEDKAERKRQLVQSLTPKPKNFSFTPRLLTPTGTKRTQNQFNSDVNKWIKNRDKSIKQQKEQKLCEEAQNTYRPQLWNRSMKISKKLGSLTSRMQVSQKRAVLKRNAKQKEESPSFTPVLRTKSANKSEDSIDQLSIFSRNPIVRKSIKNEDKSADASSSLAFMQSECLKLFSDKSK